MKNRLLVVVAAALVASSTVYLAGQGARPAAFDIRVLSNRADLLSGGDALVEIGLPSGADLSALKVSLQPASQPYAGGAAERGRDVSTAFARRGNGRVQGLVTGLPAGASTLVAVIGGRETHLSLTNYPIGGPIFAGPQVQPWICMTEEAGLGAAQDAQCNAPSKVEWFYKSTTPPAPPANGRGPAGPSFLPYNAANPPSDVAMTTTDEGKTVPYIIRRETGTLDRGIYTFAVLADPRAPQPTPFAPPAAWNHKFYWTFGGGASPGHRQAAPGNVFLDTQLGRGFAVATHSLNTFGNSFNSVTTAESVMMLKEHMIETLGEPRYTIAQGSSGGSMQQQLLAAAYPGLLDGIEPSLSFPDMWTNYREILDCGLMLHYFNDTSAMKETWQDVTVRNEVMDNANQMPGTCVAWGNTGATWADPAVGCVPGGRGAAATRPEWVYDAQGNRTGTRCTLQDYQKAVYGLRADGFANRPYDNVGVQYGLNALQAGRITAEQFVEMNEKIGGWDIDYKMQPQRSVADLPALQNVYRSSQFNLGGAMNTIPILDNRACRNTEVHSCFHSYVTRARLQQMHGSYANQVIYLNPPGDTAFEALDRWVAAVKADTSNIPQAQKVLKNRPADIVDACWINGQRSTDAAACRAANPYFGNAHLAAGQTFEDDVMKCQLKPLRRGDYKATFTDAQWTRLQAAFPSGVCDWSKPGVGATAPVAWLSFANGPWGQPLGPAPLSR